MPDWIRSLLASIAAVWVAGGIATAAHGQSLAQHEHTAWDSKSGVSGDVRRVFQAPNGMLVLRTASGWQVFDGVRFYSYLPGQPVPFSDNAGMLGQPSPTGAVYYFHPETSRLMREMAGATELVAAPKGMDTFARFMFDAGGVGWHREPGHLYRLEGLRVEEVGASWGLPKDVPAMDPGIDRRGTVWFGMGDGLLYYLQQGARKFKRTEFRAECANLAVAPDDSIWCASSNGLVVVSTSDGQPIGVKRLSDRPCGEMLFDRRGGFWLQSMAGIQHAADWREVLKPGGMAALAADAMTPKHGLTSDTVWMITEDSNGGVWLGTSSGLERFRPTSFTPVQLPRRSFGYAIALDNDGGLLAGNWDGSLMRLSKKGIEDIAEVTRTHTLRMDTRGHIWVAAPYAIWRKAPGKKFVQVPDQKHPQLPKIHAIGEDDLGAMWFQSANLLLKYRDGQWTEPNGPDTPPGDGPYYLIADGQRQLWFLGSRVFVLKGGVARELKSDAFVESVAPAVSGFARAGRMWVGGYKGVGVFENEAFKPLSIRADAVRSVTGIVERANGDLWIHSVTRILRIPAAQVEPALRGVPAVPEVFDSNDGLRGASHKANPRPTLIEDATGRLWVSSNQGLAWIDPQAARAVQHPPSTLMLAARSDSHEIALDGSTPVRANPSHIEFDYTAAALGVKDRVRFRYRLGGIDKDWQDAGTRRTAYYTQLPPGRFEFEVTASNEYGQWGDRPAVMRFEVLPAWYQTPLFRLMALAFFGGSLWVAYRMRVSVLRARERARMRTITAERERIARDLHDTLLQSMQGVILGFHGLATSMPPRDDVRRAIELQLDRADQMLGEARDRVSDLRATRPVSAGLGEAFELCANELAGSAQISVVEEGRRRSLRPFAHDRVYLIGREALLNAVLHGQAHAISVHLLFERRRFELRVQDDGVGVDPDVLASGAKPGHYGLLGMRERADELKAAFSLDRREAGGTEVILRVPAESAYSPAEAIGPRGLLSMNCRRVDANTPPATDQVNC